MFLELVATIAAGIGAAGLALLAGRISGGRLPRWSAPVAAGAAMLAFALWSEYTWGTRTAEGLPDGIVLVHAVDRSIWWKPWTYAAPQVTQLITVDTETVRRHPERPDLRLINLYLFARWRAPAPVPQLVDCARPARAPVSDAALADPAAAAAWRPLAPDDPLLEVLCKG